MFEKGPDHVVVLWCGTVCVYTWNVFALNVIEKNWSLSVLFIYIYIYIYIYIAVDNIPAYKVGTEHSHKAHPKNNSAQQ